MLRCPEYLLAQPKNDEAKAEQTEATEFLREVLRDGERTSKDIDKEAKEAGISVYALRKAKGVLGVQSLKRGGTFGGEKGWFMKLPETEGSESTAEDADIQPIQHLQAKAGSKTSYGNSLAEDVENVFNQQIQQTPTTSSNGLVPNVRMKAVCKCGADGFVQENCRACGEMLIPF